MGRCRIDHHVSVFLALPGHVTLPPVLKAFSLDPDCCASVYWAGEACHMRDTGVIDDTAWTAEEIKIFNTAIQCQAWAPQFPGGGVCGRVAFCNFAQRSSHHLVAVAPWAGRPRQDDEEPCVDNSCHSGSLAAPRGPTRAICGAAVPPAAALSSPQVLRGRGVTVLS